MGFDTNGNWTSDFYPETDRDEGIAILASKFQQLIQTDIKGGFDNCLTRDGAGKPDANLNFNGHKITNLADGELATDAQTVGQAQSGVGNYANDTSASANAITITLTPSIGAYTTGQRFYFKVANTNTLSEVSFRANGLDLCRVQMDGSDNLASGALKQNCIYEGVYCVSGSTSEATYAGRRLQIVGTINLANVLNDKQVTNCIISAPNGVATYSGLVVTVENGIRFLMYHGLNADGTINNIEYVTSSNPSHTFAGTEADGTYYLFISNAGVVSATTSNAQQTDKAIFAECVMESGAITSFTAYGALELLKKQDTKAYIVETYADSNSWYRVYSDGWCEQGGFVEGTNNNRKVITFLKQFADTNYTVVFGSQYTSTSSSTPLVETSTKATTGFTLISNSTTTFSSYWEAKGFIS